MSLSNWLLSAQPLLQGLEATAVGRYVRTATLAYPIAEIVHLIGVAALFGTMLWIDLNLLKPNAGWPVTKWGRAAQKLVFAGFLLVVVSGGLMFVARATEMAANSMFWIKMLLLALAGVNAVLFHLLGGWRRAGLGAKIQALCSLLLWVGVLSCGRMIAYV